MALSAIGRNLSILLFFLFTTFTVYCNDFFERVYSEINTNIENEAFEDNFRLIKTLEKEGDFLKLDCYSKGKIYHKIGVSYYLMYRESDAIEYYESATLLWGDCAAVSKNEVGNTYYNLGVCHRYLGNTEKAKNLFDRSLSIFENSNDYSAYELGLKYHGIGQFYESIRDRFRAQLYFSNAINLLKEENAVLEQFEALNSAVTLHLDFKDYETASKFVEQALELARMHPNLISSDNLVPVYLNATTIRFELGEFEAAENYVKKVLNVIDSNDNLEFRATSLEIMAFLNMEKENFKKAEKLMSQVLSIREQFDQTGSMSNLIALTHENFAELYLRQGLQNKANDQLAKGFRIVAPNTRFDKRSVPTVNDVEIKNENTFIRLMELKTRVFEAQYESTKDFEWLQHSLNAQLKIDSVIKRGLASFQFEQSKLDFLNTRFKHYGKAIKDAMRLYDLTDDLYYLQEAYQFSAKTKALVLQQELNRVNVLRKNVSDTILKKEEELRTTMNERRRLLSEAEEKHRDSLLQNYIKAQSELDYFLSDIEKNEPAYYQERYRFFNVPSVSEVQKKLPKDLAAVEFFVAEDRIYSFWMTSDTFFSTLTEWNDELKNAVQVFSDYCAAPNTSVEAKTSQLLYDRLLGEGLKKLQEVERLCFIPDGELHSISFEALKRAGKYLIEDYAVSYTYAAALLDRNRIAGETAKHAYVGFGADYSDSLNTKLKAQKRFFGDGGLSKLVLSEREVKNSASLFDGETFLGKEATLANYYEYADDAQIVHLSLHGLVDADDPDRSCIIFDDSQEEFLLSPKDLYRNHLKANLVLLSACHSASGKIYNGEGVQGMSKAFLLGGAHNILSSLWNASESSSLAITNSFLTGVKNRMPHDLALQKAKMNYLENATPSQKHPYYWANFIIIGETEAVLPTNTTWYIFIFLVSVMVVAALLYLRYRRKLK